MLMMTSRTRPNSATGAIQLRPARPEDAEAIAHLTNLAGDGLPMALWQSLAGTGGDAMVIGSARIRRTGGAYSFTRTEIAELDGRVAGAIIDYPLGLAPDPITPDTPSLVVPLNELENLVCGSWYVNILAVQADCRRRGIGHDLLAAAEMRAKAAGKEEISLIVSDANAAARALYHRHGFVMKAAAPMVKTGWDGPGTDWLLLHKWL
ncbi:acetyltransferase (GNAT) family protein [Dongia mobilis]|uniref:Acetyltransferase (GNAT) family protein n=1 Tax=Dongia mobilis TaxID=578943 RepID=A0A4R6WVR8_9PROT|nr:GNAT family N-acetyltransferase [Dongia mobilis]TDQ83182.1 acetyltransferase (GNAT) family protein [Dongia mobilis]